MADKKDVPFEGRAVASFTRPWPTRRGLEPADKRSLMSLVRAAPADVTAAFVRRGARATPDALDKDVAIGRGLTLVLRLRGHAWTIVVGRAGALPRDPKQISQDVDAAVIDIASAEEGIEYSYFEHGARLEHVAGTFDAVDTFESTLRPRASLGEKNAHDAADAFLKSQDAYLPDLSAEYFFGDGRTLPPLEVGTTRRLANPGFTLVLAAGREVTTHPDIEKLDYLTNP